jgi:hypothetical protein
MVPPISKYKIRWFYVQSDNCCSFGNDSPCVSVILDIICLICQPGELSRIVDNLIGRRRVNNLRVVYVLCSKQHSRFTLNQYMYKTKFMS